MYRRPKTSLFSFCIGVIPQLRSINGNSPKLDIFFCKFGLGLQHKLYGSTKGKKGWENSVSVRLEHSQHILRTEDKWRRRRREGEDLEEEGEGLEGAQCYPNFLTWTT